MKDEVNDRLLQYLRQNSEFISGPIEKHMKMISDGQKVSLEDRMGNLNLIAMERQEFLTKITKIRKAFRLELRNTKQHAAVKAKEVVKNIFEDLKAIFI